MRPVQASRVSSTLLCEIAGRLALRLDNEAANDWTHGLPPATSPRISLTFRRLNAETKSKFEEEAQTGARAPRRKKRT